MSFGTAKKNNDGRERLDKGKKEYESEVHGKIRTVTRYPSMPNIDGQYLFKPTVHFSSQGKNIKFN